MCACACVRVCESMSVIYMCVCVSVCISLSRCLCVCCLYVCLLCVCLLSVPVFCLCLCLCLCPCLWLWLYAHVLARVCECLCVCVCVWCSRKVCSVILSFTCLKPPSTQPPKIPTPTNSWLTNRIIAWHKSNGPGPLAGTFVRRFLQTKNSSIHYKHTCQLTISRGFELRSETDAFVLRPQLRSVDMHAWMCA